MRALRKSVRHRTRVATANPLKRHFYRNRGPLILKWLHYFPIYHRHFRRYRRKRITVVEIGVFHGGSLQMWRRYFGQRAKIVGVDIDPRCEQFAQDGIEIEIGDQTDRGFLRELKARVGPIDVLIDDGGHTMEQQITTFEELFPAVRNGGVYLVEDLHTSYWPDWGGGYRREGTFIEYAKGLIDQLHAWHCPEAAGAYSPHLTGMHIYDSVIVLERGVAREPRHEMTGRPAW